MRSERAAQHGCVRGGGHSEADYGHAGIKSLQLRRWRGYLTPAATVAGAIQWLSMMSVPVCFVQDVLLGWRHIRSEAPRA